MNSGPAAASPYQQAKQSYGGGLPSGPRAGPGGLPGGPRGGYGAAPPANDYGAPPSNNSSYGAEKYGSGGGYGASAPYGGAAAARGPSGYGGLGRTNSVDTTTTEDNRDALFGGARDRYKAPEPRQPAGPDSGYGESGASSGNYGAYGEDRQLTAEEEEEG
jgi:hypothetical protein